MFLRGVMKNIMQLEPVPRQAVLFNTRSGIAPPYFVPACQLLKDSRSLSGSEA